MNLMKIKLIATDLDGTLIPAGKSIPESVLLALNEVIGKGILLVPATGRSLSSITPEILSLAGVRYLISSNGAVITDRKEEKRIYERLIPADQAADILERLSAYPVYSSVYMNDRIYNRWELPSMLFRIYRKTEVFRKNPQKDLPGFVRKSGFDVEKIFVAVDDPGVRSQIQRDFSGIPGVGITSSAAYNLEFNCDGADKGHALAWLCQMLGISPECVAAMGDNENDYTMLSYAGFRVVPENASEDIKTMADRMVPDCRNGGMALFLKECCSQKEN